MSEYQYYEFLAIDRPLTDGEQAQVRTLSTRASISASRFVNEYEWGAFHGDPLRLQSLTASQRAFVDFLRIDAELLEIAQQTSLPIRADAACAADLAAWIKQLSPKDKDAWLTRIALGESSRVHAELQRAFRNGTAPPRRSDVPRRRVADLLEAAGELRGEGGRQAAAARIAEQERRELRNREIYEQVGLLEELRAVTTKPDPHDVR